MTTETPLLARRAELFDAIERHPAIAELFEMAVEMQEAALRLNLDDPDRPRAYYQGFISGLGQLRSAFLSLAEAHRQKGDPEAPPPEASFLHDLGGTGRGSLS